MIFFVLFCFDTNDMNFLIIKKRGRRERHNKNNVMPKLKLKHEYSMALSILSL